MYVRAACIRDRVHAVLRMHYGALYDPLYAVISILTSQWVNSHKQPEQTSIRFIYKRSFDLNCGRLTTVQQTVTRNGLSQLQPIHVKTVAPQSVRPTKFSNTETNYPGDVINKLIPNKRKSGMQSNWSCKHIGYFPINEDFTGDSGINEGIS